MHTKEKLSSTYAAIDKVMALASEPFTGKDQIDFELDVIGLYVGAQMATLQPEQREGRIQELVRNIHEVIDARTTRPTIAELEAILNDPNPGDVKINPDGSVAVSKQGAIP